MSSDYCGKWDVSSYVLRRTFACLLIIYQVLNSLLKAWKEEKTDKVLVFTKSVKLLDILDFHLQKNCMFPNKLLRHLLNISKPIIFADSMDQQSYQNVRNN